MAMEMLLRRMKVTDATVHGFRSSFRDWAGDKTSFPRELAEAALGAQGRRRRGACLPTIDALGEASEADAGVG